MVPWSWNCVNNSLLLITYRLTVAFTHGKKVLISLESFLGRILCAYIELTTLVIQVLILKRASLWGWHLKLFHKQGF